METDIAWHLSYILVPTSQCFPAIFTVGSPTNHFYWRVPKNCPCRYELKWQGEFEALLKYDKNSWKEKIYVLDYLNRPLLGRTACHKPGVITKIDEILSPEKTPHYMKKTYPISSSRALVVSLASTRESFVTAYNRLTLLCHEESQFHCYPKFRRNWCVWKTWMSSRGWTGGVSVVDRSRALFDAHVIFRTFDMWYHYCDIFFSFWRVMAWERHDL